MADPASVTGGSSLGDMLSGFGGNPVNRPALNAAVMQGQAMAGLRTAQTEEALGKAAQYREEAEASDQLESVLSGLKDQNGQPQFSPSQARAGATFMKFVHGNAKDALSAIKEAQQSAAFGTVVNPAADPNARAAAAQGLAPGTSPYAGIEGQLVPHVQRDINNPTVIQTPGSLADQASKDATAAWRRDLVANPQKYHPGGVDLSQYPELAQAVYDHRLDPLKINSRNVMTLAQIAQHNPDVNFDELHAEATVQANPTFRQRAMTVDALPTLMDGVVAAGKKVNYSGTAFIGAVEKWQKGQLNDPALTEYMAQRNDVLLKLASVMRGVGMSDKSAQAEQEAMSPTLDPKALDAWERGQMNAVNTLLKQQSKFTHRGEHPATAPGAAGPAPGTSAHAAAAAPNTAGAPASGNPLDAIRAMAEAENTRRMQANQQPGVQAPAAPGVTP